MGCHVMAKCDCLAAVPDNEIQCNNYILRGRLDNSNVNTRNTARFHEVLLIILIGVIVRENKSLKPSEAEEKHI